jgi:hypothetical protein
VKKDWTDQPDEITHATKLLHIGLSGGKGSLAVYVTTDNEYYVTLGDLFGSQTLMVDTAHNVLNLITVMYDARNAKVPTYATLMENAGS